MSAPAVDILPTDDPETVFSVLKSLSVLEQQAIVRPTNPPDGIGGFLFDVPEGEEINLRSNITDHFVEDNTAITDEIALFPEEFTLRGLVAELASRQPTPTRQTPPGPRQPLPVSPAVFPLPTSAAAQILVKIGTLAKILAPGSRQIVGIATSLATTPANVLAIIAADAATYAAALGYSTELAQASALARLVASANKSAAKPSTRRTNPNANTPPPVTPLVAPALQPDPASLYGTFLDKAAAPPNQTRQARIVAYFYALWKARQLFTIETPWGYVANVAILNFRATQDEESKFRSSFAVTFKKIRTAGLATVSAGQLAGRALAQGAPITNNGNAGQTALNAEQKQSLLYRMATVGIPTP